MTLESDLQEFVQVVLKDNKRVSASVIWKRIEEGFAPRYNAREVTGEMYRIVAGMFQEGTLGLSDGCYYLKNRREDNHGNV
jgi:hypothetical protein